ncbi:MAG: HAD family phosphatase [Bacilli bacterium]|nr:HAD family phosphatase [Bacilli bacterium]
MKSLNELDLTKKKYIIFDMDGTLIDSIGMWNNTDYQLIKKITNTEVDLNTIQKQRDQFLENHSSEDVYLEYCAYLIKEYNLNISKEELINIRWSISGEYLEKEMDFKKDVVRLVKTLKQKGYILILATATTKIQLDIYAHKNDKMKKQMNIYDIFDLIIKKEDVKNKKPNPEVYLTVLNHFKAKPEECLVFEDSLHGVIAANKAGIEVVNVYDVYSDNDRKKINQISDYKINTYDEFIELLV